MRRLLDGLYTFSALMAGVMGVLILLVMLAQVVGRLLGFVVPSALELAGFATAALVFFGLAPTLRQGGHIRIGLLISRLRGRAQLWVERLAGTVALLASGYATFVGWRLTFDSLHYGDLAPGLLPLPLFVPQLLMALGLSVFTLALLEDWLLLAHGQVPAYLEAQREA